MARVRDQALYPAQKLAGIGFGVDVVVLTSFAAPASAESGLQSWHDAWFASCELRDKHV
jgi:hypothetical protein